MGDMLRRVAGPWGSPCPAAAHAAGRHGQRLLGGETKLRGSIYGYIYTHMYILYINIDWYTYYFIYIHIFECLWDWRSDPPLNWLASPFLCRMILMMRRYQWIYAGLHPNFRLTNPYGIGSGVMVCWVSFQKIKVRSSRHPRIMNLVKPCFPLRFWLADVLFWSFDQPRDLNFK